MRAGGPNRPRSEEILARRPAEASQAGSAGVSCADVRAQLGKALGQAAALDLVDVPACPAARAIEQVVRLVRVLEQVIHLEFRRGATRRVQVDGVLPAGVADAADAVGLAGSVLERGRGLMVVVGEQHRVAHTLALAAEQPAEIAAVEMVRDLVLAREAQHRGHDVDQRDERVALEGGVEHRRARDDERHPDRLLVGVEDLLAQAAVREADLAVVGCAHDDGA